MSRWKVCVERNFDWHTVLETDDAEEAIARYEESARRATFVAIFDDNGEGEPRDPDWVRERLEEEKFDQREEDRRVWNEGHGARHPKGLEP